MNVDDIIGRIRRGEDSVTQFKRQAIGVSCARNTTIASFASREFPLLRGIGPKKGGRLEIIA